MNYDPNINLKSHLTGVFGSSDLESHIFKKFENLLLKFKDELIFFEEESITVQFNANKSAYELIDTIDAHNENLNIINHKLKDIMEVFNYCSEKTLRIGKFKFLFINCMIQSYSVYY